MRVVCELSAEVLGGQFLWTPSLVSKYMLFGVNHSVVSFQDLLDIIIGLTFVLGGLVGRRLRERRALVDRAQLKGPHLTADVRLVRYLLCRKRGGP